MTTDKVDVEVPATASGVIVAIHGKAGDTVAVGAMSSRSTPATAGVAAAIAAPLQSSPPRSAQSAAGTRARRSSRRRTRSASRETRPRSRARARLGTERLDPARRRARASRRASAPGAGRRRCELPPLPPVPANANVTPLQGPAATLAGYMDQSLHDPDGDVVSARCTVGTLESRRAELNAALKAAGAQREDLVHAPDRLRARARRERTCPA